MSVTLRKRSRGTRPHAAQESVDARNTNDSANESTLQEWKRASSMPLGGFAPRLWTAFCAFAAARMIASLILPVADCDETYNYWEPLHYLLFGTGFQTWEYAPRFALRSWSYIGLHAGLARLFQLGMALTAGVSKVDLYFAIKLGLGIVAAACDTLLYSAVLRRFGPRTGWWLWAFLLFSPGLLAASVAFVPSSFAMCCMSFATAMWLERKYFLYVFSLVMMAVIGWPFALLAALPTALHAILEVKRPGPWWLGFIKLLTSAVISAVLVVPASMAFDRHCYRRWVVPSLNIVLYNVFGDRGPELYGTEPWYFYLLNGTLNFNVVWLLALYVIPVLAGAFLIIPRDVGLPTYLTTDAFVAAISPFYLWTVFMSAQPHKEERFLFVVYPLVALCAALSVSALGDIWRKLASDVVVRYLPRLRDTHPRRKNRASPTIEDGPFWACFWLFVGLSVMRVWALSSYYSAPQIVWSHLSTHLTPPKMKAGEVSLPPVVPIAQICIGKEWYRFPGSFFLPDGTANVSFVKSSFDGLLPKHFASYPDGLWKEPSTMNDENREEMDRYVDIAKCDYWVDVEFPGQSEPRIFEEEPENWEVLTSHRFLDASESHSKLLRAFYVPILSERRNVFRDYRILKRK